jgi:nicotinate phosphoribosyltransferase
LQVELAFEGKFSTNAMGPEGVLAARNHHKTAISELNSSGFRLSKGEPAIPTYFV